MGDYKYMKLYRLCNKTEVELIFKERNFINVGHECYDNHTCTHRYKYGINYMHFFDNEINLLYMNPSKEKYVCIYNVPVEILENSLGKGMYLDFINLKNIEKVDEYAIESEKIRFEYLKMVYSINNMVDFDYVPDKDEIYSYFNILYDFNEIKLKMENILTGNDKSVSIYNNIECFLTLIPEIKSMIGFEHKHPHHHLDVWNHTLEVLNNLDSNDLDVNIAALLHDIGKPYCYQEGEVRHFRGHPEVSYDVSLKILTRLGYDKDFIDRVSYLVTTHDTIINPDKLDNNVDMIEKRLELQYADALAHHPDKIEKRIKYLDIISKKLYDLGYIKNVNKYTKIKKK